MKRKTIAIMVIAAVLASLFSFNFAGLGAESEKQADFVMKNGYVNPRASEILAIEGSFEYDTTKYTRGAVVIDTNKTESEEYNGQFFFHTGAGDKFTFTVDFGDFKADKFSYLHYGGAADPTEFDVYANGVKLGSGESTGGTSWVDIWDGYNSCLNGSFEINPPLSGLQTIVIELTSSSPAWPANNIGFFEFFDTTAYDPNQQTDTEPDFVMTEDSLAINARKVLLKKGAITRDSDQFITDHAVGVNSASEEQPQYDGMFFIHTGAGDTFTFTVDFGDKIVDSMSYMSYGQAAETTDFDLFINGELMGSGEGTGGNGWELEDYELANYDEFKFSKTVTGLCTVKIVLTSSSPAWPANNVGMYTFYEAAPATPTPEGGAATDEPAQPTEQPTENVTAAPATDAPATEAATEPSKTDGSGTDNKDKTDGKKNTGLIIGIIAGAAVLVAAVVVLAVKLGKKKK
ncbi:MAG: hypothetical protein J5950_00570 [Clostridia bacterium]|nr:hypothetical protein [Clostridia bacterium]